MVKRNLLLLGVIFCVFTLVDGQGGFTTTKIGPKPIWNATLTDKLRHDLLLNYDKFSRPTQHYNKTTVKFGINIRHLEINEFKSTITVHSWAKMLWNDDKLKWNPADYGDLGHLNLADHEIWQPDLFLYNSATATAVNSYGNTHCIVYATGEILWVPPTQFTAICELNLRMWPFDTQECKLQFGSWTYHGEQIDLQMSGNASAVTAELLTPHTEWNLVRMDSVRNVRYYNCCAEAYPDVTITLVLERRSPSYKALIVTPAFAIIMLTLMSFWLPSQAGEKIILNGFTTLFVGMFLLYFTQKIPAMGTHTPLIVFFYSSSLYISCFSMANSVLVLWISRTKHSKPLPWALKQPLVGWLGKWLCISQNNVQLSMNSHRSTAEEMRDHQVTDFEEQTTNDEHQMIGPITSIPPQNDWLMLAAAIDRISFLFYSFLFTILAIAYSL